MKRVRCCCTDGVASAQWQRLWQGTRGEQHSAALEAFAAGSSSCLCSATSVCGVCGVILIDSADKARALFTNAVHLCSCERSRELVTQRVRYVRDRCVIVVS